MRYKSTDLIEWSLDCANYVLKRSTADEGYDVFLGQVADPCIIEVNNKCYMYYASSSTQNEQVMKLAIADMTLAQLVLTNEGNKL